MRNHWPIFLIAMGPLLVLGSPSRSDRAYEEQPAPLFLFQDRPIPQPCVDRPLKVPRRPGSSYVTLSPQAPFARTRLEHLAFSRTEIPSLTLAGEFASRIEITGGERDGWAMRLCARGEGDTGPEALARMQTVSMTRVGSTFSMDGHGGGPFHDAFADLWVDAPADAPVTVHTFGWVKVRDMNGSLRISSRGRTTILNSPGKIDFNGDLVDYSGSSGTVNLNAATEINLNFTAQRFDGKLSANGRRPVRALLPRGFETPFQAVVGRRQDFICRADVCSQMQPGRENGLYTFTYKGDGTTGRPPIWLRSENSTVVIDNLNCTEMAKALGSCGQEEKR